MYVANISAGRSGVAGPTCRRRLLQMLGAPPWVSARAPNDSRRIRGAASKAGQVTETDMVGHVKIDIAGFFSRAAWPLCKGRKTSDILEQLPTSGHW
jgi:hypothetical protein